MNTASLKFLVALIVAVVLGFPVNGMAQTIHTHPDGYQVVPTQNSPGTANFRAKVDRDAQTIAYDLSWQNLKGDILQSHIHFGRRATNGDIVVFLCTNLGNTPPSATPAPLCFDPNKGDDPRNGMVHNVIHAGDIVALAFGGILPGQQLLPFSAFDELANAIDAGAAYVVVHTQAQPSGELRGQIPGRDKDRSTNKDDGSGLITIAYPAGAARAAQATLPLGGSVGAFLPGQA
jgi:hypothetical protein